MSSTSFHLFGCLLDRVGDPHIGSTATKVATQSLSNLIQAGSRVLVQESLAGHHETRGTITTLLGVIVHKRLLHRMQFAALSQSFYGRNLLPLSFQRDRKSVV